METLRRPDLSLLGQRTPGRPKPTQPPEKAVEMQTSRRSTFVQSNSTAIRPTAPAYGGSRDSISPSAQTLRRPEESCERVIVHPKESGPENGATSRLLLDDFFLSGEEINREVIQHKICEYLGPKARVRPSTMKGQQGFMITAFRAPTLAMIASLKDDSRRFEKQTGANALQNGKDQGPDWRLGETKRLTRRDQFGDPGLAPEDQQFRRLSSPDSDLEERLLRVHPDFPHGAINVVEKDSRSPRKGRRRLKDTDRRSYPFHHDLTDYEAQTSGLRRTRMMRGNSWELENRTAIPLPKDPEHPTKDVSDSVKRTLRVDCLDPGVTDDALKQIFEVTGHVRSVHIMFNMKGEKQGRVEYHDPSAAERAVQTLNGRLIHQKAMRVSLASPLEAYTIRSNSGHYEPGSWALGRTHGLALSSESLRDEALIEDSNDKPVSPSVPVAFRTEEHVRRSGRGNTRAQYNDGLTEEQWLQNVIDDSDKTIEVAMQPQAARMGHQRANKKERPQTAKQALSALESIDQSDGDAISDRKMYITYSISDDRSGNQEGIMVNRLAALGVRCGFKRWTVDAEMPFLTKHEKESELKQGQKTHITRPYFILVTGLGPEVNESVLLSLFQSRFRSCQSVSAGYNADSYGGEYLVQFTDEGDQKRAFSEMQGVYCGSRPMHVT